MCVSGVDKQANGVRQRRIERESRIQERQQNEKRRKLEHEQVLAPGDLSVPYIQGSANIESGDDDKKIEVSEDRNLTPIPTVALEVDRYGISNRAAAAISTAVLIDCGIVTSYNKMNIIDHHKVGE